MSPTRAPKMFEPENLHILALDFTSYSRSIILEVLRGLGCSNHAIAFAETAQFHDEVAPHFDADLLLFSHEVEHVFNFDFLESVRRSEKKEVSEAKTVLVSSVATRSLILTARDTGIDEIVIRPLSPAQLRQKLKKLIESPRKFITSSKYLGPCRRRKLSEYYAGPRRRLADYESDAELSADGVTVQGNADELATAVSELREACGKLTDGRVSLVNRVRSTAERTAAIAREKDDFALAKTAEAVQMYLDGVGTQNQLETHVLETGINALTQLSVLPTSYRSARDSVSNLMMIAVRKKLLVYEVRQQTTNTESETMLEQINAGDDHIIEDVVALKA